MPGAARKTGPKFKPVEAGRPADAIAAQIREQIARQVLKVGDRLPSERALETQFHVSRNSVRQALKSLADMGLLVIRKGGTGGAFVNGGGSDAVQTAVNDLFHLGAIQPRDLTEVRITIGAEAARLACQRATKAEIDALERNVAAAEDAVRNGDTAARHALNLEFHRMLARMTHNSLLATLTATVIGVTEQFSRTMPPVADAVVMPLRRRLLGHLRARASEEAAAEMRAHLRRLERYYLKQTAGNTAPTRTQSRAGTSP